MEERGRKSSHINAIASLPLTFSPSETVQGDFFNSPSPILQCQNDKRPTSHPEALLDVGFYGTAALVGSLAFFSFLAVQDSSIGDIVSD